MLTEINVTWYLLPLAAAVSFVYSASRYEDSARIVSRAVRLFGSIILFMGIILGVLVGLSMGL